MIRMPFLSRTPIPTSWLPFADAASENLPLLRLLRLSLFQVTVGMALVLLTGTLNRVMIVELGMGAGVVAAMIALPVLFAPARALIGHKSDNHRSYLGWRRVPYLWFGTMLQFGGFAILPFALLVLTDSDAPRWFGTASAAAGFLLVGAGLHTVQTAGLALASDLATDETRPRVVALLYVMLLVGMLIAALGFGQALMDFSSLRLIQVIQAAAVITVALNVIAVWQQEVRDPERTRHDRPRTSFRKSLAALLSNPRASRLLLAVAVGTAAFSMQDILLEPYGGEMLGLSVGATTELTALFAAGTLAGIWFAARRLSAGRETHRSAAIGILAGVAGFAIVIFADPLGSAALFRCGVVVIGFGAGLFGVGTLSVAMRETDTAVSGLALGAWGATQAAAAGVGIAAGGALRDGVAALASAGAFGQALAPAAQSLGYITVYHFEIALLFAALVIIGPLARFGTDEASRLGLTELPG
ncbi:MAG: BCD family MFS transporter [Pseudomonadota bacterium]